MGKSISIVIFILILGAFGLAACAGVLSPKSDSLSVQQTQVMRTVSAVRTQQAFETLVAQATQQGQITPEPQVSATPWVTTQAPSGPVQTIEVPVPTAVPTVTATPILLPCNAVGFVKDVTAADGTEITAGARFTKTWRLVNNGTCTWTRSYDLVFVDGDAMGAPAAIALTGSVRPGETVDLSVDLVAPATGGTYKGLWMLRDGNDKNFGLGGGKDPFWVSIKVSTYKSDALPTAIYPYDFSASICLATWKSSAGKVTVPCLETSQREEQWASILMNPLLEGKVQEDERTIWMHINNPEGWLQGFYPASIIQKNDHFIAFIGCLNSNTKCDAIFSLDYRIDNGEVQNLGKWTETLDGKYTKVDIDLSQFEGKNLGLILGATNKNASGAVDLFWLVPSIRNVAP